MTSLSCEQVRELAAELALGVLPGWERAAALAHISGCAGCRDELDELAGVADVLLLLGPEAEPPAGFESRVIASIAAGRSPSEGRRVRPQSWPLVGLAAVVAVILGLVIGSVAGRRSSPSPTAGRVAVMVSRAPGWKGSVVAAPVSGHAARTQVFLEATSSRQYGTYTIEVVDRDGGVHRYDGIALTDGKVLWSRVLAEPMVDLRTVRMVTSSGTVLCQATFTT
jgi:hypothetical protein